MIETAEFAGSKKCAVVTIEDLGEDCVVLGVPITPGEIADLNRAREYLRDTCMRMGVPIAKTLEEALALAVGLLEERCGGDGAGRGRDAGGGSGDGNGYRVSEANLQ